MWPDTSVGSEPMDDCLLELEGRLWDSLFLRLDENHSPSRLPLHIHTHTLSKAHCVPKLLQCVGQEMQQSPPLPPGQMWTHTAGAHTRSCVRTILQSLWSPDDWLAWEDAPWRPRERGIFWGSYSALIPRLVVPLHET